MNRVIDQPEIFPFPFGLSEFTTMPWSFEEDVERYAIAGVDCIEVCEFKLDDKRFAEQMQQVAAHGLRVSAVQALARTLFPSGMQPNPQGLEARLERFRLSIERLAPFCRGVPFVLNTGAPLKGNIQEVVDVCAEKFTELARFAEDHGVQLALEPLNPSSMNAESAIWTVRQALELIDRVNRSSFGLCLDLWNNWQDAEFEREIREAGERIFVFQVSDWRTPRSSGDRLMPGKGSIPIGSLVRQVHATGYYGSCTVEIFSNDVPDSLYKQDMSRAIGQMRLSLETAWQDSIPL